MVGKTFDPATATTIPSTRLVAVEAATALRRFVPEPTGRRATVNATAWVNPAPVRTESAATRLDVVAKTPCVAKPTPNETNTAEPTVKSPATTRQLSWLKAVRLKPLDLPLAQRPSFPAYGADA